MRRERSRAREWRVTFFFEQLGWCPSGTWCPTQTAAVLISSTISFISHRPDRTGTLASDLTPPPSHAPAPGPHGPPPPLMHATVSDNELFKLNKLKNHCFLIFILWKFTKYIFFLLECSMYFLWNLFFNSSFKKSYLFFKIFSINYML